mmetsp:Transcript_48855/g.103871  ORF Transcript_48855/g.103871 Transcript_48855/m.103871 type:complete len:200 (-) Transcript_48855:37-636(-)
MWHDSLDHGLGSGRRGAAGRRGALDFRQEVLPSPSEALVPEAPELGSLRLELVVDLEGVGELDLAKAVEVELPHERAEFVVLEELGYDGGLEEGGVLHDEGQAVLRPAANVRVARVDHVVGLLQEYRHVGGGSRRRRRPPLGHRHRRHRRWCHGRHASRVYAAGIINALLGGGRVVSFLLFTSWNVVGNVPPTTPTLLL